MDARIGDNGKLFYFLHKAIITFGKGYQNDSK